MNFPQIIKSIWQDNNEYYVQRNQRPNIDANKWRLMKGVEDSQLLDDIEHEFELKFSEFHVLEYVDSAASKRSLKAQVTKETVGELKLCGIDENTWLNFLKLWNKWKDHFVYSSWCVSFPDLTHPELLKWHSKTAPERPVHLDAVNKLEIEFILLLRFPKKNLQEIVEEGTSKFEKLSYFEKMFQELSTRTFIKKLEDYLDEHCVAYDEVLLKNMDFSDYVNVDPRHAEYLFKTPGEHYHISPIINRSVFDIINSWLPSFVSLNAEKSTLHFKPIESVDRCKKFCSSNRNSELTADPVSHSHKKNEQKSNVGWSLNIGSQAANPFNAILKLFCYAKTVLQFINYALALPYHRCFGSQLSDQFASMRPKESVHLTRMYEASKEWVKLLMTKSSLQQDTAYTKIERNRCKTSPYIEFSKMSSIYRLVDQQESLTQVEKKELTSSDFDQLMSGQDLESSFEETENDSTVTLKGNQVFEQPPDDYLQTQELSFDADGNFVFMSKSDVPKIPNVKRRKKRKTSPKSYIEINQFEREWKFPHGITTDLERFYNQRYRLFSKYDHGIQLDSESWFSVTPEILAMHHAEMIGGGVVVDAFCGVGGNAIQLAMTCDHVIAIDIDQRKLQMAKNNAEIYGVAHKISFIQADFMQIASTLEADGVLLSPPWGGTDYVSHESYDVYKLDGRINCINLMKKARAISSNIALFLPRSSNIYQIMNLAENCSHLNIELSSYGRRGKAITAYFYSDQSEITDDI